MRRKGEVVVWVREGAKGCVGEERKGRGGSLLRSLITPF